MLVCNLIVIRLYFAGKICLDSKVFFLNLFLINSGAIRRVPALIGGIQQRRYVTVNDNRPVNLNLSTFKWPITALVSIPHRISGFAIFLFIPLMLCVLQESLASQESFDALKAFLDGSAIKLLIWFMLMGLVYHFVAGIKHLIMDLGIGETLQGGKRLAVFTLTASAFLILVIGVWLI
jgi:succinate dehydrogenase / fumarate reductase cytochrome b subunit